MIEQQEYTDFIKKRLEQTEKLLSLKQYQINSLLDITQAINNNFTDAALFRIYEFVMRTHLEVQKLILFVEDEKWKCAVNFNGDEIVPSLDVENDLLGFNKVHIINSKDDVKFHGVDYIFPVIHKQEAVGYALISGLNKGSESHIDEKIKFVQTITNLVTVAIENKKLLKQQLVQQMVKRDMDLARQVQNMLIPAELPDNHLLEMAAFYNPHREIGGDYYDVITLDDNKWLFCIADISGKGLAAGLLMANFQANLRTLAEYHDHSLEDMVTSLNKKVNEIMNGEKFITMFIGIIDLNKGMLQYVNAGHNPSLLINGNEIVELTSGCPILGMLDELPFLNPAEIPCIPGSVIINYTDGLTDVENEEGIMLELEDLKSFIKNECMVDSVSKINKLILDYVINYKGETSFMDDISLLTCKIK